MNTQINKCGFTCLAFLQTRSHLLNTGLQPSVLEFAFCLSEISRLTPDSFYLVQESSMALLASTHDSPVRAV